MTYDMLSGYCDADSALTWLVKFEVLVNTFGVFAGELLLLYLLSYEEVRLFSDGSNVE